MGPINLSTDRKSGADGTPPIVEPAPLYVIPLIDGLTMSKGDEVESGPSNYCQGNPSPLPVASGGQSRAVRLCATPTQALLHVHYLASFGL